MNYDELNRRLEELKIEDFIWIIYVAIIFLSWMANHIERKYFLFNDLKSKKNYRKIMLIIFSILIAIYVYFLKDAVDDLNRLKPEDSFQKKFLTFLSFVASLLITLSGLIFLYIIFKDENIDLELAFN